MAIGDQNTLGVRLSLSGAEQVNAALAGVRNSVASVATVAKSIATGAAIGGVTALTAGLAAGMKHIVDMGGKLADMQARTSISIKGLVVLRQAFTDAGLSADEAGTAAARLAKTVYEAATNGGQAADALSRLGLNSAELINMRPEQQFAAVAKALGSMGNDTERAATAMAIFGRGGNELLSLFRDPAAMDMANRRVGSMGDLWQRNAEIIDAIGDTLGALHTKIEGVFLGIADQVGPALRDAIDGLNDIDLTGLGRRIGAFIQVAIDYWKSSKFEEFVAISMGAAFEQSVETLSTLLRGLFSIDDGIGVAIGRLLIRLGFGLRQAWADFMSFLAQKTGVGTAIEKAASDQDRLAIERAQAYAALGMGSSVGNTNRAKLAALTSAKMGSRDSSAAAGGTDLAPMVVLGNLNKRMSIEHAIRQDQEDLLKIEQFRGRTEADFAVSAADKWEIKRRALNAEIALLSHTVDLIRAKADMETDESAREQLLSKANGYESRLGSAQNSLVGSGPNPFSVQEQMTAQFTALQDKWGTVAENIARTITDTIGTAVSSISEGITGLIMQTKTWGQALRSIYTSVLTSLIHGIVQMGVQWMLTHVFMKGITIAWHALLNALGWTQVAQTNAQEAAKTPGLAVNASLASAGSYGTSAVVGIALMLAMIGVAIAAATGAFAQGGLVNGPGGPTSDSILARLSAGEYVIPAAHVDRLGAGYFDSIRAGGTPGASGGSNQNVHVYFDRAEFLKASRDDIGSIAINAMKRGRA